MDVSRMDPISAKLAVELQLSDINDILDEIGGSRLRGDQRIGFETMKTEMEGKLQLLETQVLIYNLLRAEHDSRVAFSKLLEEEKQAVDDHKLAMNLQGLRVDDPHVRSCAKYEESLCDEEDVDSDDEWNRARELYSSGFCRGVAGLPPLDEMGSEDHSDVGDGEITCNACLEAVPTNDSLELACDHTYCRTCLTDHFKSALTDTGLFPPRCCKIAIPVDICRAVLPKDMVKEFDLKVEELAHPNPTYCYNAECAEFIQAKNITNDVGNCVFCRNKTCVLCKCEEHAGLCPTDPHVVLLKDLANRSKWQQCSRCKNMVELAVGCFHMTYVLLDKPSQRR
jgi:E3 ubiquitin-protein ligase RNF144